MENLYNVLGVAPNASDEDIKKVYRSLAMRFHRGLALAIAAVCGRFKDLPIVLGGGVFQNRLLVELLIEYLQSHRQPLGLPGLIPPNDGGLAAGQLVIGLAARESGPVAPHPPGCRR